MLDDVSVSECSIDPHIIWVYSLNRYKDSSLSILPSKLNIDQMYNIHILSKLGLKLRLQPLMHFVEHGTVDCPPIPGIWKTIFKRVWKDINI